MKVNFDVNESGMYLVRLNEIGDIPEGLQKDTDLDGALEILRVWRTDLVTNLGMDEIGLLLGREVFALKEELKSWLYEQGIERNEWVRINIHPVM